jgi:hypothetical protein
LSSRPRKFLTALLVGGLSAACLMLPAAAASAGPDPFTITTSNATPAPGDQVTITVSFTNPSASDVVYAYLALHPTVGATNWTRVSCAGDINGCTGTDGTDQALTYTVPIAPGATRTASLVLKVKQSAPLDSTISFDTYSHYETTAGPSDILRPGVPTLTVTSPPSADVAVSLTAGPHGLLTSRIDYTVTITNTGPGLLTSAGIRVNLSGAIAHAGSSSCAISGHTATCNVGPLAVGASTTAAIQGTLGLITIGSVTSTATRVSSTPTDPNAANDSSSATCTAITSLLVSC